MRAQSSRALVRNAIRHCMKAASVLMEVHKQLANPPRRKPRRRLQKG